MIMWMLNSYHLINLHFFFAEMDNLDMDVDLLPSEDGVQRFLSSKLRLIEERKRELTEQLTRRQSILEQTLKKASSESSKQKLTIGRIWKRIVNNTYVIGINILSSW